MAGPTLDLGNLLVHLNADISQYKKKMKEAERLMKATADKMTKLGKQMTLRVTVPLVALGAASVKAFASFDDAMTKSLAIMSGITPKLRKEMEDLALSISSKSVTSATDLGKAYFFLASAGLDAQQSMAALNAVEQFAVAGAFDMSTATDLATDAQSALGLTVKDAQQNLVNMTRVTDVLTGANTLANASTEQFALALTAQAGPAMKAYGIELEEGVAVLAAYADQGIKAQNAGNLFSRMLRLMTKGFLDNEQVWKRFNINIFNAVGALKPMYEIVGDLSNALGDMAPKQKIATLALLGFQARSQQAILPLLGLQDRIEAYNNALLNMKGITDEISRKQLKSFSSQMKILWNNIKNAGIGIGKILAPALLSLNKKIKSLVVGWSGLSLETKKLIINFTLLFASMGPVLLILGSFIKVLLLVKVAALAGVASIGILMGSILALYVAVGSFALGKYFHDEFKIVQQVATITATGLLKAWVTIKFGFKQMTAGMIIAWDKFVNQMGIVFAEKIAKIIGGFGLLGVIVSFKLRGMLEELKAGGPIDRGMKQWNKNVKDLSNELSILDAAQLELFKNIEFNFKNNQIPVDDSLSKLLEELVRAKKETEDIIGNFGGRAPGKFQDTIQQWADSATNTWVRVGESFASAFDRMGTELATFLVEGKANFNDFAKSVMKDLLAIIIRAQIIAPIATGLSASIGSFFGSGANQPIPVHVAAKGGIFPGHFEAFANGGIVNKPTFGLIGEGGGPEAVIPLKGGNVPVDIRGMQAPTIIINNNTGRPLKQDGLPSFDGKNFIISVVTENINQFGILRQTIKGL